MAIIFSEKSIPLGIAPALLTASDTYPGPQATSNTDMSVLTSAAPTKYGINCRVSDDQTESYLSATRSQPSCSKRVKSSWLVFIFLVMVRSRRVHKTLRTAKRLQLLQGEFDWFFFLTGNQLVSVNHSRARIP